jgi:hypothetical protein
VLVDRFKELMACFRKPYVPGEPRCTIIEGDTYWEGERWVETLLNGDTMTIGGQTVPLHTQFLVCEEHTP